MCIFKLHFASVSISLTALKALVLIRNPNKISASCCCCSVLGNFSHTFTLKKTRDGEQGNIPEARGLKGQLESRLLEKSKTEEALEFSISKASMSTSMIFDTQNPHPKTLFLFFDTSP